MSAEMGGGVSAFGVIISDETKSMEHLLEQKHLQFQLLSRERHGVVGLRQSLTVRRRFRTLVLYTINIPYMVQVYRPTRHTIGHFGDDLRVMTQPTAP